MSAAATHRVQRLVGCVAIALASVVAPIGAAAVDPPPYVERGHQTESRLREYHDRIERLYRSLSDALQKAAPDLLARLAPPPPDTYGYQVLPLVTADGPSTAPGTKSQVVRYSWGWSDALISRQNGIIDRLEGALAQASASAATRASWEERVESYRAVVASRRTIDSDIQYNWTWQRQIADNRPLFDALTKTQDAVVEREALAAAVETRDEAVLRAAAAARGLDSTGRADAIRGALAERLRSTVAAIAAAAPAVGPRDLARISRPTPHQWLVDVPLYTDITDAAFVEAFRQAIEGWWQARAGSDQYHVRLTIQTMSPRHLYCGGEDDAGRPASGCTPPAKGDHIDLEAHVARFPAGAAVLTTGGAALNLTGNRAIVLGPYNVTPRVLAHEFGHVLGIPDAYYRGYQDLGADGFEVTELADLSDIMGAPGSGPVLVRDFDAMMAAKAGAFVNRSLDLYRQSRFDDAIGAAREALTLTPDFAEAYNNIAASYAGLGRWDDAIVAATEAVRLKPDLGMARNNLAWARAEQARAAASGGAR